MSRCVLVADSIVLARRQSRFRSPAWCECYEVRAKAEPIVGNPRFSASGRTLNTSPTVPRPKRSSVSMYVMEIVTSSAKFLCERLPDRRPPRLSWPHVNFH